jgi:HEAT repeat protein
VCSRLLLALNDVDESVRGAAAAVLYKLKSNGKVNFDAIIAAGQIEGVKLSLLANCELLAMSSETIPILLAKLAEISPEVRVCAVKLLAKANKRLGWTKGHRKEAVYTLTKLVNDPDRSVRIEAIKTLASFRSRISNDVIPVLVAALSHNDGYVCLAAADALWSLDNASVEVKECIKKLTSSADLVLREKAREFASCIMPDDACDDELTEQNQFHSENPNNPMEELAAKLQDETLENLTAALKDSDIAMKLAALDAIDNMRSTNPTIAWHLVDLLRDSRECVSTRAKLVLSKMIIEMSTKRFRRQNV